MPITRVGRFSIATRDRRCAPLGRHSKHPFATDKSSRDVWSACRAEVRASGVQRSRRRFKVLYCLCPTQIVPAVVAIYVAATNPRETLSRQASRLSVLDSTVVVRRLVQDQLVDEHRTVTRTSNPDSTRAAPVGIRPRRHRRALLRRRGRDTVRILELSSSPLERRGHCVKGV